MSESTELFFQESTEDGTVPYTVTELSLTLKQYIENNFNKVEVRGEVSGVTLASSGHLYFSLKDENSVLKAVCWRYVVSKLSVSIEEGLDVICKGNITTYPGRSYYQINIESIKPAGQGALLAMLEKRKKKFEKEGLFDESRKKPLPKIPKRIGIITSSKGAVIKDILHRIEDRFPLHVILWDVQVQGNEAAVQVAEAIDGFNKISDKNKSPDILIVARGGGSIEDLWAFNEEIVIRAVANSNIPIISAIGHETDITLIDYVADKRAPTPTAAAEMAVPVKKDLMQYLEKHKNTLSNILPRLIAMKAAEIQKLSALLEKFTERFIEARYLLKRYGYRVDTLFNNLFVLCKNRIEYVKSHIKPGVLDDLITQNQSNIDDKNKLIKRNINNIFDIKQQKTELYKKLLISYNHKNILKRGFSIVRNQKQHIVNSANLLEDRELIHIEFYDGHHKAIIKNKTKNQKSSTIQVKLPF